MTAQFLHGLVGCPSVKIMARVWIGLEGTGVTALRASLENAVRETSMSAFRTPATPPTAWIAYSCPTITCACANPASQVRDASKLINVSVIYIYNIVICL